MSYGQNYRQHEIGVHASGGLSGFSGKLSEGSKKAGTGYNFGLNYTYMFSRNIGLGIGAEFAIYNFKSNTSGFSDEYKLTDDYYEEFYFRFKLSEVSETQQLKYINIPIMLMFQSGKKLRYYAGVGGKIGIPLKGTYENSEIDMQTSVYYPVHDLLIEDLRFRGLGTFSKEGGINELELKTIFMLTAEAGLIFDIAKRFSLYIGAFFDYGITDIINGDKDIPYLVYNVDKPLEFENNSMLDSKVYNKNENYVKKAAPFHAGLKLRFCFGKKKNKYFNLIEGDMTK
jgi:hypothetical protein